MMQRSLNTIFALITGPFLLGLTGRNQAQLALSDDFCSGQIDSLPPIALPGTSRAAWPSFSVAFSSSHSARRVSDDEHDTHIHDIGLRWACEEQVTEAFEKWVGVVVL